MFFGNTIEEQYMTIVAINRKLKKWGRITVAIYSVYLIIFLLIAFSNSDNLGLTILYSVIIIPIGAIFLVQYLLSMPGRYIAGLGWLFARNTTQVDLLHLLLAPQIEV